MPLYRLAFIFKILAWKCGVNTLNLRDRVRKRAIICEIASQFKLSSNVHINIWYDVRVFIESSLYASTESTAKFIAFVFHSFAFNSYVLYRHQYQGPLIYLIKFLHAIKIKFNRYMYKYTKYHIHVQT